MRSGRKDSPLNLNHARLYSFADLRQLERETSQIRAVSDIGSKEGSLAATGGASGDTGLNATVKDEPMDDATIAQRRQADKAVKRSNPHKYLLYRPTLSQLMVYLSTAFKVRPHLLAIE